jgi:hypothetical protein
MQQTSLFPPPGGVTQPPPREVQREALQLLAELIVTVLTTASQEVTSGERNQHE